MLTDHVFSLVSSVAALTILACDSPRTRCSPRSCETAVIPAGPFVMGCAPGDSACKADELPTHTVTLSAFEIGLTPVVEADYQACVAAGVCSSEVPLDVEHRADNPVRAVNWVQADIFCHWVGMRLPTEAEWEKAARGTTPRKYPWGDDDPTCSGGSCTVANFEEWVGPVGQHRLADSPYGVHDVVGSVWQWVSDVYDAGYYATSPQIDPLNVNCIASPCGNVIRGGGAGSNPSSVRVSHRESMNPQWSTPIIGFRCVRSL